MGTRQLEYLFSPSNIAVIGASERKGSMGGAVFRNLMESEFKGQLYPVNSKGYKSVYGHTCYTSIRKIKHEIDLAIVCTPPETVGKVLAYLDRKGVQAAIVLSGGLSRTQAGIFGTVNVERLIDRMRMRVMGPECLGIISPHNNLNASYSHVTPTHGDIAYIGQSGTFGSAMLDWAVGRKIGFSHFATLGHGTDVRISDIADYLLTDQQTRAVVVQLDRIMNAPRLLRSLRILARRKPVVGLISPPESESSLASLGLNSSETLYRAALTRAGIIAVDSIEEMFNLAELLTRMRPLYQGRLAVLGNGQGTTQHTARLIEREIGPLGKISNKTLALLRQFNTKHPVHYPLVIPVDSSTKLYEAYLEAMLEDANVDAIVVSFAPTRGVDATNVAKSVTKIARKTRKNIFAIWMGEATVMEARALLDQSGALAFDSPQHAIQALKRMIDHNRQLEELSETPVFFPLPNADSQRASQLLLDAQLAGRSWLLPWESIDLLSLYNIHQVETGFSDTPDGLIGLAEDFGYPVAVKVVHEKYCLPFAYGSNPQNRWRGVEINLSSGLDVVQAAKKLESQKNKLFPQSPIYGYSVQPMRRTLDVPQFSAGITRHPTLGPMIFIGQGGSRSDIFSDRRVAVPPLNTSIAENLIDSTRLAGFILERAVSPKKAKQELIDFLLKLNQISAEHKNLAAIEMNGFIHPEQGVMILGSATELGEKSPQLFRSYPGHLSHEFVSKQRQQISIRPVRAEDEPRLLAFLNGLSAQDMAFRFFSRGKKLRHQDMVQLSQIDYDREMAFVAISDETLLGEVRVWIDPDNLSAEYAIVIAEDAKGQGLGKELMKTAMDYCFSRKVLLFYGSVLAENNAMHGLAKSVGLEVYPKTHDELFSYRLLRSPTSSWQRNRLKTLYGIEA